MFTLITEAKIEDSGEVQEWVKRGLRECPVAIRAAERETGMSNWGRDKDVTL